MRELWEKLNQKYLLFYDDDVDAIVNDAVYDILVTHNIFADMIISSDREELTVKDGKADLSMGTGVQYKVCRPIKYGEFLKRIFQHTSIPVAVIHSAVCKFSKEKGVIDKNHFNENTVAAFCSAFKDWKIKNLQGRFKYSKSKIPLGATALTYPNGDPKPDISQGRIGRMLEKGTPIDKYLYEEIAFDSPEELENITHCPEHVTVYGKIPTKSIMLPTIVGETYSPDFMYVVKRADGTSDINIVVETKDYDTDSDQNDIEKAKISCAELFFKILKKEGYNVHYEKQLHGVNMAKIIQAVLDNSGK